jgi:hypothetical protein
MAEEVTTQFVREDPRLEAIKLNLLSEAAKLAYQPSFGEGLPTYQVAGFSPAQEAAVQAGMQQGVGSFLPYIEAANVSLGGGYGAAGQGIGALGTAQIAGAGAAGAYDPRSAAAFINPYQQAVTEQTLAEIFVVRQTLPASLKRHKLCAQVLLVAPVKVCNVPRWSEIPKTSWRNRLLRVTHKITGKRNRPLCRPMRPHGQDSSA